MSIGTLAIATSKISPDGISSFLWPLLSSPAAKVSAISKPVSVPATQSLSYGLPGASFSQHLGHANEHRDWRIYADFAQVLIAAARDLYGNEPFGVGLSETVYALSLFPWGKFRRRKSSVKLHTLLDQRGSIPTNVYVTGGQVHDVNILDQLLPEAGAFYLLGRGYEESR